MSKYNKVNKDHYMQAGRLTPGDMARERQKQGRERVRSQADRPANRRAAPGSTPRRTSREG